MQRARIGRALRWLGYAALLVLLAALGIFFFVLPGFVDKRINGVIEPPPYTASPEATNMHGALLVADLHADSLLWGRDLTQRSDRGHVDILRLSQGNVALQVFSVVTKSPRGLNIERNEDDTDDITLLAIAQRWPLNTWFSLRERALYQADRLRAFAAGADGRFVIVRSERDLRIFLNRRLLEPGIVGGLLAIEGAHVLEGDVANVDVMFDAGYRMMSLAHFFDSELAGSAHGVEKGGLTELGREVVKRMEAKGMIVDLAHASDKQVEEVLDMATRPVVVSHGGVKGTCDNRRNLSDDQLKGIAKTGGLIGIGFWQTAVCGKDAAAIVKAIRYTADVVGIDHVALGSDFDGAVATPFDASGLVKLTEALLKAGFSADDIGKVMGGNEIRFLLENLPD
jgi:microsomal dipeptidase-like Zn-dependent dipeptidase